jgi:hypothetical protein
MYTSLNNVVVMTRGDSLDLQFEKITLGEYANYTLQGDDTLYFGLMDPGTYFEDALVKKVFTADDITTTLAEFILELSPEDTVDLLPGKYFYALKLHLDHTETEQTDAGYVTLEVDKVITVINKTKFIIND